MRTVRMLPLLLLAALLVIALGACGSSSAAATNAPGGGASATNGASTTRADDSTSFGGTKFATDQAAQKVSVSADATGQFKWDKTEYTATAGDVTFVVKNPSTLDHEFSIDGNGINYTGPTLKAGSTGSYTIKGVKAGTYRIVCKVAGHEQLGMVASLIVK